MTDRRHGQAGHEERDPVSGHGSGRIFLTGGTGFVGGNIRQALAGRPLRLLVRNPEKHPNLASANVEVVAGDVTKMESLAGTLDGCDTVIHLVAIISEESGATFDEVIRQGTENVLTEAQRAGVRRIVFMSALGAQDNATYPYLKAKWDAEQAVKDAGIPWTIFRPSVIFGPGDGFINVLANLVRTFPIIPVVGSGQSKFQPVSVGDVALAFVRVLDDPMSAGQTFELGGPDTLTYEQLLDVIADKLGMRKRKAHVPVGLMKPIVKLSKPLPKALRPPVTQEQLKMLALNNCTDQSATAELIDRPPLRLQDGIDYILDRGRQ